MYRNDRDRPPGVPAAGSTGLRAKSAPDRGSRTGAPDSRGAGLRWQHPGFAGGHDGPVHTTLHEVLDYFEKCPQCGYAVQASSATLTFPNGRMETTIYRTCGMPCGWQCPPQIVAGPGPFD